MFVRIGLLINVQSLINLYKEHFWTSLYWDISQSKTVYLVNNYPIVSSSSKSF